MIRLEKLRAYGNLGNAYHTLVDYQEPIKYDEKHLKISIEIGDRAGEGSGKLCISYQVTIEKANGYHEERLQIGREAGDPA